MKQSTFPVIALTAAAVGLFAAAQNQKPTQAPEKIRTAVIDVQRILAQSEEGKREIARIKKVEEGKAQQLAQIEAEVNKLKERLTDLGFSISEPERTKLQREIEDKVIEGERFRKDSVRQLKKEYTDVLADFEKKIGPIVESLGSDRGIQIIFHRDNPVIAWADSSIDITPDVITRFNKQAGGASARK